MERELLESAAAGHASAFSELLRRHLPALYDFSARLLRDSDEARALLEEVIRRLAAEPALIAGGDGFRAATVKLILDEAVQSRTSRKAAGARAIVLNAPVSETFCRSSMALQQTQEFDAGLAVLVWQVAASLDRRQFAVLDLWTRQGLSQGELAQVLGLSPSAVAATTSRMEKSVEEILRAVILSQRGRRWCHELDLALADEDRMRIDEELRRRIAAHIQSCNSCLQTAGRLPSGLAIYRTLQPLHPPPGLRSNLLAGVLTLLRSDAPEAPYQTTGQVVSRTGRIVPLNQGLRVEGTIHSPRQRSAIHVPRFRASRVRLQAGDQAAEDAYSYEYSSTSGQSDERRMFFIVIGGLVITGLLGLLGLLFVTRMDDDPAQPATINSGIVQETAEEPRLTLSLGEIDFGSEDVTRLVTLETGADQELTWTIESEQVWLAVNPAAGSIAPGESVAIEVAADRTALTEGLHTGRVVLAGSGGEELEVPVELVVPGTGPTISEESVGIIPQPETAALVIYKAGCEPQQTAFRVSAAIEDPSGVLGASLIYSVGQDEPLNVELEESQGRWDGSIPPLTRDGPLVFHIEATDTANNVTSSQPVTVELRDCATTGATPGA